MPTQAVGIAGGTRKIQTTFPTRRIALDLTSERSSLGQGAASVVIGRDVTRDGRLAKAGGRKPIEITYPQGMLDDLDISKGGHPLTTAIQSEMSGNFINNVTIFSGEKSEFIDANRQRWQFIRLVIEANTVQIFLTPEGVEKYGHFQFVDQPDNSMTFRFDDLPWAQPKLITSISGFVDGGGLINMNIFDWQTSTDTTVDGNSRANAETFFTDIDSFHFSVSWPEFFDKRGIWVSNGRKFWLLQNGAYTEYADLGPQSQSLGIVWKGSQISPSVFMFVNPNQPPRIITLQTPPRVFESGVPINLINEVESTKFLGGLLPPRSFGSNEEPSARMASTQSLGVNPITTLVRDDDLSSSEDDASTVSSGTEESPAVYRIRMRAIDKTTGAASAFVDCFKGAQAIGSQAEDILRDHKDDFFSFTGNAGVLFVMPKVFLQVENAPGDEKFFPFKTARATHVQFWRTESTGTVFYLELEKAISWPDGHFHTRLKTTDVRQGSNHRLTAVHDIVYSTALTANEYDTILRQIPSDTIENTAEFGRHACLTMPDSELVSDPLNRPQLFFAVERSGGLPPACKDIASILGMTIAGGSNEKQIKVFTQGKLIAWPRISSDEQVRWSEISGGDAFLQPESFNPRDFRTLNRQGDEFKGFVAAGDTVIAVFRNGAYKLTRGGVLLGNLFVSTQIAEQGVGTPWANAILPIGKRAAWITPNGVRIYDPEANEGAGGVSLAPIPGIEEWFAEALREGMDIDAGYDERVGTLHIRRTKVSTSTAASGSVASTVAFEISDRDQVIAKRRYNPDSRIDNTTVDLVFDPNADPALPAPVNEIIKHTLDAVAVVNLNTGEWTIMEDDNGLAYVQSTHADQSPKPVAALYSVDETGAVFEENYNGNTHPYDGFTVQGKLDDRVEPDGELTFRRTRTTIEINARHDINKFSFSMSGDIVRFVSTDPLLDGLPRRVKVVTRGSIEFDELPADLNDGDSFIIGAVRFRLRWSAIRGNSFSSVKTLNRLEVITRPGRRHENNPDWPDPPEHGLTVRVYRDFGNKFADEKTDDIVIADTDDVVTTTEDRYSGIETQGRAVEVEIESINARTDFIIDSATALCEESGDLIDDVLTTD